MSTAPSSKIPLVITSAPGDSVLHTHIAQAAPSVMAKVATAPEPIENSLSQRWSPIRRQLLSDLAEIDQQRGKALSQRISEFVVFDRDGEWSASGKVQGSRRLPYEVSLLGQWSNSGWQMQSHCSCPLQQRCKHVAALLQFEPELPIVASEQGDLNDWISELKALAPVSAEPIAANASEGELRLYFQLQLDVQGVFAEPCVRPLLAVMENQRLHVQAELSPFRIQPEHARMLNGIDLAALKELAEFEPKLLNTRHVYPLKGQRGLVVLEEAIRAQRLVATGRMGEYITLGASASLHLQWMTSESAKQRLSPKFLDPRELPLPHAQLLATEPWSLFDALSNQLMRVKLPQTPARIMYALSHGVLQPGNAETQLQQLRTTLGNWIPDPQRFTHAKLRVRAQPVLRLSLSADKEALLQRRLKRRIGFARQMVELPIPGINEPLQVTLQQYLRGVERVLGDRLLQIEVDVDAVQRWHRECLERSLEQNGQRTVSGVNEPADWLINADYDEQSLSEFCFLGAPKLKKLGWKIEYSPGFPLKLIEQNLEFTADVKELEGGGYFDVALGIEINGQKYALQSIIESGLANGRYSKLPDNPDAIVPLYLPEGPVPISVGRLKLILSLYQEQSLQTRLPRMRAGLLNELEFELGSELRWHGEGNLRPLAERLEQSLAPDGLPEVETPRALQATLRNYQVYGLRWLKFLSDAELAGILADDMGLGKTVQVIAHILLEQQSLAPESMKPVIVVAPTSVLPNWRAELQRFAPSLKVLSLTGSKRIQRMSEIPSANVLLTSYALLGRDLPKLLPHDYHLLVLDEAQWVKNPSTIAAKAARQLRARHRLCLTGTPLENHLGELWAQFDFLMPGFLGSKAAFQKHTRTPIEKRRDPDVLHRLKQRIAPFLLRRTKDQVVAELPPKSVIVKRIELDGKQRDIYETLRVKVRAQVQAQLQEKGQNFSRINLLDALLKLRQICCDPRLLPRDDLTASVGSAKLDHLSDMLQSLVSEGRRVLVFSQFTTMLGLIETELQRRKLRYLILTGASDDRETPVKRFQNREVPIFLISLRAGGVGLNLTAADTVVHYDPWWNPAVEEQATDRAYRIGQDKPVFVYRLIAANTVEERIEELKAKKRDLADALLDDAAIASFSSDELLQLLED